MTDSSQIQIFQSSDGKAQFEVTFKQETLWQTQLQIGALFDTTAENVLMHLKNIYAAQELSEDRTTQDFLIVCQEGKREVERSIKHYSLDAIIAVGYRVSSSRATQFRIWATNLLKQQLVDGYTLNQKRLQERGIKFDQAMQLLSQTLVNQAFISPKNVDVISIVNDYARSWSLLQAYDEQSFSDKTAKQTDMQPLALDSVLEGIAELKKTLMQKGEATELFGQMRGDGLESAIMTIEQGFGDELLYPNIASRAAHLLYFVIKNHPLADGNKRTGSFLFLWYLRLNQQFLTKPVDDLINDNTLVALALLVADSKPDQRALIIQLIQHFILLKEGNGNH